MKGLTYVGPPVDDVDLLSRLPFDLAASLAEQNGYVALRGGLHVRGACVEPAWHSLRNAWEGPHALHALFPDLKRSDIPVAEDCFGDQFLLRDGEVIRLEGESGLVEPRGVSWDQFLRLVENDATQYLALQSFERYLEQGRTLGVDQSLSVYPPFITTEGSAATFSPIPKLERISFLADFSAQVRDIPDGQPIKITFTKS